MMKIFFYMFLYISIIHFNSCLKSLKDNYKVRANYINYNEKSNIVIPNKHDRKLINLLVGLFEKNSNMFENSQDNKLHFEKIKKNNLLNLLNNKINASHLLDLIEKRNLIEKDHIELFLKDDNNFKGIQDLCPFDGETKKAECIILIMKIIQSFESKTNISLVEDYIINEGDCRNELYSLTSKNNNVLTDLIQYSGKSLQDYGLEGDCIRENHSYYIIEIIFDNQTYIDKFNSTNMNKFLGMDVFQVGLCFAKNCSNYIYNFFNRTKNEKFFNYTSNFGVSNIQLLSHSKNNSFKIEFINFSYFLLAYLSFKLICTFFGLFVDDKSEDRRISDSSQSFNSEFGEEHNKKKDLKYKLNKQKSKGEKEKKYVSNENQKNIYKENYSDESDEDEISFKAFKENILDYEKKLLDSEKKNKETFGLNEIKKIDCIKTFSIYLKKLMYYLYNIFSYIKDFNDLIDIKNEYYRDEKIEFLSYYKSIILFMYTYNYVFYISINLPHRNYFNIQYFISLYFGIFKMSIFVLDCYIVIEAVVATYKLMNFLKKNKNENFITFLKFYIYLLPKISVFFIIYFFYLINFEEIGKLLDTNTLFKKILNEMYNTKECYCKDKFEIFNIYDFCFDFAQNLNFTKCFRVVYIYVNIFVSFNIFIFIFYFSYKIRSKIFDCILSIVILVLGMLNYLEFKIDAKEYTFQYLLGQNFGFKILHLFLIKYFIGVLVGLYFFYSFETVLTNSILNKNDYYMPFGFVYDFIIFINIKRKNKKDKNNYVQKFNSLTSTYVKKTFIKTITDNNDSKNNSNENNQSGSSKIPPKTDLIIEDNIFEYNNNNNNNNNEKFNVDNLKLSETINSQDKMKSKSIININNEISKIGSENVISTQNDNFNIISNFSFNKDKKKIISLED